MALLETQVVANELERVSPKLSTLFDRDAFFFANVEKRPAEVVSARQMRVPLELRPGGNYGAFNPEGGDLGRGDGPTFDKAVIDVEYRKHGIEWTKKAEWATDSDRKAVLNTFRYLLAKGMSEFRRQLDSEAMTAGDCAVGTITSISNAASKDTYTLTTDGFGARLMRFGQWVAVYAAGLAANRTITPASGSLDGIAGQIDLYDLANKQIRINGQAASVGALDRLVINGKSGANPTGLLGVLYHHSNASTGTWLGFNRANFPEIRANRVNAAGALALPFPRLAMNKIGDRVGLDNQFKAKAWMHPCQKQAYEELGFLVSVLQKQPKDESLDLYFGDNMQMAGAPVKTSFSWDKTRIDFIVDEVWGRNEMHPVGFYTNSAGEKLFELRGSSGGVAAADIFYLAAAFNFFVSNPAACAYIDGLTVPSGY